VYPVTAGILNINKPLGPTSHDVVSRVRILTGMRRAGHAGTLDPLATGVLLVCVGRATRVTEYLMAERKIYRAYVRLGITTDTHDAEGQVVAETKALPDISRNQLEAALDKFLGTITQVPPTYSAVKHKGTPLHRLARQGVDVERILTSKARQVTIFQLQLTAWDPPDCTLEITCSSGTYVRALARDLGQTLGCGAHLSGLTRLASGRFRLEQAITLADLARAAAEERWADLLHPIDTALTCFPTIHLDADGARRVCSGQAVRASIGGSARIELDNGDKAEYLSRVYGPDGSFLALVAYDPDGDVWRPRKVFVDKTADARRSSSSENSDADRP
jgi:tRNA pseudouridine55 synthase